MAQADDLRAREPARPTASALGSTSLVVTTIVLMSAAASFGAVRVLFPKARTLSTVDEAVSTTNAAAAAAAHAVDVRREIDRPITGGRLSIVTDPAGARVEIDGRPRGVSPLEIDGLAAAEHRITVVSDSGVAERRVAVRNDVVTEVVFSLPKPTASSTAPIAGWVSIKSPFPVEMLEHDEVVGSSGATKIMLGAGTHDVVMRNEALGFEATRKIAVAAGKVTDFEIDPPRTTVNMNALPWADVLIDGQSVGQTPLSSVSVAIGTHQVSFRHPQFGERNVQIVVTERGPNRVAVDFTK